MNICPEFLRRSRKGGCLFSLIKLAILALVVIAVTAYFCMSYLADYALKTITAGTPITAGIGSVYVNPFSQKVDLTSFYITNPQNYNYKGNAIAFDRIYVDANFSVSDYFSKKLIHIEEVSVDGLDVVLAIKSGTLSQSNLTEIVEILKKKAGMESSPETAQEQTEAQPAESSESVRIILDKLVFKNSDIKAGYGDNLVPVPMPSFEITNLGVQEGGLTPGQLVASIMEKLTQQITVKAVSELTKSGLKNLDSALKSGTQNLDSAFKSGTKDADAAIKSGVKDTKEAVKSLTEGLKNLF